MISADYERLQECGGEFEDGRYFLRGESDDPVCVKCEERRLKA
jgi:paxillin